MFGKVTTKKYLLVLTFFLFWAQAIGQNEDSTMTIPQLNKHYFSSSNLIRSPFINTFFFTQIGFAQSFDTNWPVVVIDGQPVVGVEGDLLFATIGVTYQQKIKDWLAFNVDIDGGFRLGSDFGSFIAEGVSTVTDFEIGWLFRVAEKKKYLLSSSFYVSNSEGEFTSVSSLLQDIADGNPQPSLRNRIPALIIGNGWHFAYGFTEIFGIEAQADVSWGENFDRGSSGFLFIFGTALDFNFYKKWSVPIGINGSYKITSYPSAIQSEDDIAHFGSLKIGYTGESKFLFGVESWITSFPITSTGDRGKAVGGVLYTQYFF